MNEPSRVVVFVTSASEEEARSLARLLLERKKAACVNIVPGIESLYWWEGKIDSARESLLIVKTRASLVPDVVRLVKQAHSYEVPEVIALPITAGSEDYLKWLDEAVQPGK